MSVLKKYHPKHNAEIPRLFSVVLDQGLMSITTLLTTIVLARTYDKGSYADLVLLFSITLFALGFQSALVSKPYAINLNDFEKGDSSEYFMFNTGLKLVFTLVMAFLFPILYYVSYENWDTSKFLLFLLYISAHSSYFFVRETLLSERKTKKNLHYGLVCSLSVISVLIVIFYYQIQNITFFLILVSVIYLATTLFFILRRLSNSTIKVQKVALYWKVNWETGKWLLGSNFLFHLSTSIYPWLLLYLTDKDNIAVFSVLMSVAGLVNPILTAFSSYLLPLFVKMSKNFAVVKKSVQKSAFLFTVMAVMLVFLGYFFGQDIITLLFGNKYGALGMLVIFPFLYQAINIISQPFKIALNAIKRTDVNFWILIPRSIIAIGLGYFLIREFGLAGAFYTMLVENLIYQILNYVLYARIINTPNVQIG